jgi:hypothetical protein
VTNPSGNAAIVASRCSFANGKTTCVSAKTRSWEQAERFAQAERDKRDPVKVIDANRGKFDGRAQFANSSPAHPRCIFDHDQYGNWAGGGGYTIRQGLPEAF